MSRGIRKALDKTLREHWREAISPAYAACKRKGDHYTFGLCYVASEAFLHLARERGDGHYKPCVARIGDTTHWWIEDTRTGKIVDPTAKQFPVTRLREFYKAGRGCGFLTKEPSRRAQFLIGMTRSGL